MRTVVLAMAHILFTINLLCAQGQQIPEFKNESMLISKDSGLIKLEKSHYQAGISIGSNQMSQAPSMGGTVTYQNGSNTPVMNSSHSIAGQYDGAGRQLTQIVCADTISPVRTNTNPEFIVKLPDPEVDPEPLFFLTKAVVMGKNRIVYTQKTSFYGTEKKHVRVNLEFKKVVPGVYKIVPEQLEPRTEYALVSFLNDGRTLIAYLFGTN